MLSPARTSATLAPALLALFLLMATGCAKEEVVAPAALQHHVQKALKPGNPDGNGAVNNGNSSTGNSPITDDGDDMGDNERTTKPK